jgi:hypothetical protein
MCNITAIFPQGFTVRPEELDKFFRPPLACVVLFALSSIEGLLPCKKSDLEDTYEVSLEPCIVATVLYVDLARGASHQKVV